MKPQKISELFKISKQRVNYWIHHGVLNKRKRITKLTRNEKLILIKWAKDKPINLASAIKLQMKFNSLPRTKKENRLPKKNSLSTANKTLNSGLSKPKLIRKVFYLTINEKAERLNFLRFMMQNSFFPDKIFLWMRAFLILLLILIKITKSD